MVPQSEFINAKSYESLFSYHSPTDRVFYCCTESVPQFFKEHAGDEQSYILVSAYSDYGPVWQQQEHPNGDALKRLDLIPWQEMMSQRDTYFKAELGPFCHVENCNPRDRYSMKSYADTFSTFDEIPPNCARWFTTNLSLRGDRLTLIPFGINDQGDGVNNVVACQGTPKDKLLYVNFQNFTRERHELNEFYKTQSWATCQNDVSHQEYIAEMAKHKFVLCPSGNGLDCYRVWEALYLGCVPILKESIFSEHLMKMNLPIAIVDHMLGLTESALADNYPAAFVDTSMEATTISYWKDQVMRAAAALK